MDELDERGLKALALAVRYGEDADLAFKAISLEEERHPTQYVGGAKTVGETDVCEVCGQSFIVKKYNQRFCSPACHRRYYHQHRNVHPHRLPKPGEPILREFHCKNCGILVQVVDYRDRRKKFCSQTCEKRYWKDKYLNDPKDCLNSKSKRRRKSSYTARGGEGG